MKGVRIAIAGRCANRHCSAANGMWLLVMDNGHCYWEGDCRWPLGEKQTSSMNQEIKTNSPESLNPPWVPPKVNFCNSYDS